jgi:hypothetical protein
MTGMKEGAGEDPFAEESSSEADMASEGPSTEERMDTSEEEQTGSQTSSSQQSMRIPYKFRRDGVQEDRVRVPLFLKPETKRAERDALREMEARFGADVSLTDLREALMKAGLDHLDDAEQELEAWGYGMTFEE